MRNKIIIICLIVLLVIYGFMFYYYYEKYVKETRSELELNSDIVTVDKAINFINNNKIQILDKFNISYKYDELSNQNKLKYLYLYLKDDVNFIDGVSYTKMVNQLKEVFGKDSKITNESLLDQNKNIVLEYDQTNEVYKISKFSNEYNIDYSIYNHVLSFNFEKDRYILMVNKIFIKNNIGYSSIDDMNNDVNSIFRIDNNIEYKEYILQNIDSIEEKLYKYKYVFKSENNNLVLYSYQKAKKD